MYIGEEEEEEEVEELASIVRNEGDSFDFLSGKLRMENDQKGKILRKNI